MEKFSIFVIQIPLFGIRCLPKEFQVDHQKSLRNVKKLQVSYWTGFDEMIQTSFFPKKPFNNLLVSENEKSGFYSDAMIVFDLLPAKRKGGQGGLVD